MNSLYSLCRPSRHEEDITLYKNRFFWPKMTVQITDFVRHCPVRAQTKLNSPHGKAPLQPIEVNEPFVFLVVGPLPETTRGNKHLLVGMDHCTK